MLCTVIDIRGDYAFLKFDETSILAEFALALLPFDIDIGSTLRYENFEFTLL